MTTANQAAEAIYARVAALFPGAAPNVAFTFEGEGFTEPRPADANSSWVRFSIRTLGRSGYTLGPPGARKYQVRAALLAQVFTAHDKGRRAGDLIGQSILGLFEGVTGVSGIDFLDGVVRESGTERGWMMHVASVDFAYYETK